MTVLGRCCQNLISGPKDALETQGSASLSSPGLSFNANIENPIKMLSAYAQRLTLVFVKQKLFRVFLE